MRTIGGIEEVKRLVGQEVGASDWLVVEQSMIDGFGDATLDHQWIHVDAERARKESPFGTTIAHGFMTLSLLSHLRAQAFRVEGDFKMGINYGLNRVRFPSPVRTGSRVRGRFKVEQVEDIPGGTQIVLGATVEVEGSPKPAMVAEWILRYYQ